MQVPSGILSTLLNLHINTTYVYGPHFVGSKGGLCIQVSMYNVYPLCIRSYVQGAYAEWINNHPEVLRYVIPLLLQGLKDVELAQPATLSLKEVVRENVDHLKPFAQDILTSSQVEYLASRGSNCLKYEQTHS